MAEEYEIRGCFDKESIVVWQAYPDRIADPALKAQKFVSPFSFHRMTWIKPSFAWMMHRSQWGQKSQQSRILAVHIRRGAWEDALAQGVLTHPHPGVYESAEQWRERFEVAKVHIQWDTERDLRGRARPCFSIQVGISRHLIRDFSEDWIVKIEDFSPRVKRMRELMKRGKRSALGKICYPEKPYPLRSKLTKLLGIPESKGGRAKR